MEPLVAKYVSARISVCVVFENWSHEVQRVLVREFAFHDVQLVRG